MTPAELLQTYGMTPAILVGFSLIILSALVVTLVGRRRRPQRAPVPTGAGAALAFALEGHHDRATEVLEALVRAGGAGRADAVVGLVAVLRAQGAHERATNLVSALADRGGADWIDAVQVRLALDRGRVARAAELAGRPGVPVDLAVAALARAGRFGDALAMYESRVPKKARSSEVSATLLSGMAATASRGGEQRTARKLLKRALSASSDALAVAAVGRVLHQKAAERDRLEALLEERTGLSKPSALSSIRSEATLEEAATPAMRERALASLREHLDGHPADWEARRVYGEWMLAHGEPADWRSELAEVLSVLPEGADEEEGVATCRRCGHYADEAFFVCPRCDACGSLETRSRASDMGGHARPSEKGATLAGLTAEMSGGDGDLLS